MHVHSPKVFLNNQYGKVEVDEFIAKISESGIVAVGLTNYFRFDDLELNEIREKLTDKGITVFPNIEFRTEPPNQAHEYIHIHVLFSDNVPSQKIMDFLTRLPTLNGECCKNLTLPEIKTEIISIDTLKRTLDIDGDIKHLRDYLIIASPRGQGSFRPKNGEGRANLLARTIDKHSDMIFGNAKDTGFFLNLEKDRYLGAKVKPVLLCSDAHKNDDIGKKFSWIKADVTFEGLKQTLYEPEKRVKIQERNPSDSKTKRLIIDHVVYKTVSGKKKTVYFSKDLNSIIGKRGSGKSTLLKNLAEKIDEDEFSNRDKKSPYHLDEFEVIWEDGQKNSGTKESPLDESEDALEDGQEESPLNEFEDVWEVGQEESFLDESEDALEDGQEESFLDESEDALEDGQEESFLDESEDALEDGQKDSIIEERAKSILYIPQGYLSALAYDDGERVAERDALLTQLLMKNESFAKAIDSFKKFASDNKVLITKLIEKLHGADDSIKENMNLLKKQGTKAEIQEEIKHKNEQINKCEYVDITDKEIEDYYEARESVEDNENTVNILKQDKYFITTMKETGTSISISDQNFSSLSSELQEIIQKELWERGREIVEKLLGEQIEKIDMKIKRLDGAIINKKKLIMNLNEKIKENKALETLTKELTNLKKAINYIESLSGKLTDAKKVWIETINDLVAAYDNFESQQSSIYGKIKFDEDFSFTRIEVVAQHNNQKLQQFVDKNINTITSDQSIKADEDIKALFGGSPKELSRETVKKLITGLIVGTIVTKVDAGDISTVLAQLLENRFEIDYINSVKTKKDGTPFRNMTGGQKAIVLLELIFRFDDEKYPILIDQPEDDLDVGGVASDLVKFITAEKQNRQIIIVTHSASLLVCADTENVIVSSIKGIGDKKYDFSYETGSIENTGRQADIIRVLEGGKGTLKRRMLKLNIR